MSHLDTFRVKLAACQSGQEVNDLVRDTVPGIGIITRRRRSVLNMIDARLTELGVIKKPRTFTPYDEED